MSMVPARGEMLPLSMVQAVRITLQKRAVRAAGAISEATVVEPMAAEDAMEGAIKRSASRLSRGTAFNTLFLLTVILTEQFIAGDHWLPRILLEIPQYPFVLPTLLLLLLAIRQKKRLLIGWNLFTLLMFVEFLLGFNIPLERQEDTQGIALRIISYNIRHGAEGIRSIAKIIQEQQIDVICLQETDADRLYPDPVPRLKPHFPGWYIARHADVATISRYPILSTRTHPLSSATQRVILETLLDVEGKRLTIFNLHYAVRPQAIPRRQVGYLTYMHNKARLATEQTETVIRTARTAQKPLLIIGDFNNPPRGPLYRQFASQYRDAFREIGWGFGYTLAVRFPYTRLDYCFLSEGLAVKQCFVPRVYASDHFPVAVEIVILR